MGNSLVGGRTSEKGGNHCIKGCHSSSITVCLRKGRKSTLHMALPLPVLTPLTAAFVYAFAALTLKRATAGGTGPWRVSFVVNFTLSHFVVFRPQPSNEAK